MPGESSQAPPGRVRLLALPRHSHPLVPPPSYLDSATAHGITAPDAIRGVLAGKPWLPPLPPPPDTNSRHPVN